MATELKTIENQVIVIMGASSGIGLATAELAAEKGAKLVLAARSEKTLEDIAQRFRDQGIEAIACVCDVSDKKQVDKVAEKAVEKFGRIDTWINNAGVSIYGRLDEVSESDSRRLFDINFWGVYNGSLTALPYLKKNGGVLINVGSEVSEAVVPLQGIYSASKHAVKGFTDALRVEIENVDKSNISITLIQPTAVDTPYPQHARNYMGQEPKLPSPMIEPERVAEAIIDAAENPTRDRKVGLMSKVNTTISNILPSLGDSMSAKQVGRQQYNEEPRNPGGALYQSSETANNAGEINGIKGYDRV